MATESWYRDNMPPYKAAFEDETITVPKHDELLQGHRAIKLVRGVPRMPEGKTSGDSHGDGAMACIYSHAATRLEYIECDFQTTGKHRASNDTDGYRGHGGSMRRTNTGGFR